MRSILSCKDKRQYLLTCKAIKYCLLALHGSIFTTVYEQRRALNMKRIDQHCEPTLMMRQVRNCVSILWARQRTSSPNYYMTLYREQYIYSNKKSWLEICHVCLRFRAMALVQWLQLPAWKVGGHGFESTLAFTFKRNTIFLPCSLVKIQYCVELPWPRCSVLGLTRARI